MKINVLSFPRQTKSTNSYNNSVQKFCNKHKIQWNAILRCYQQFTTQMHNKRERHLAQSTAHSNGFLPVLTLNNCRQYMINWIAENECHWFIERYKTETNRKRKKIKTYINEQGTVDNRAAIRRHRITTKRLDQFTPFLKHSNLYCRSRDYSSSDHNLVAFLCSKYAVNKTPNHKMTSTFE